MMILMDCIAIPVVANQSLKKRMIQMEKVKGCGPIVLAKDLDLNLDSRYHRPLDCTEVRDFVLKVLSKKKVST